MSYGEEVPYQEEKQDLPHQAKLDLWKTSFGLQAVDGLKPSKYMVELANEHIEGRKSYEEIEDNLKRYYDSDESDYITKEADGVALRIAQLLSDDFFTLSSGSLLAIHKYLFTDIFTDFPVGKFRNVNITKKEAVLEGASVQYASHFLIQDTLDYDFKAEKNFSFKGMSQKEIGKHVMHFISDVWQIHPFREGNTRTMAVFAIKYLRSLGFTLDNQPFQSHSDYFRDCLVLANASRELQTTKYLNLFTENLLFEGSNKLDRQNMIDRTKSILHGNSSHFPKPHHKGINR
ncbi:Fic family protein [Enterococcus diestrammenae]|uniref:protein adenylyltransferase n=1 Tax=Enterococcus diestrammenae TaxID=1155073 RepID=A0ABV0F212_9ENTE|nr:Fic family protein [Enterococcus diestrammenae]KAF1298789.1 hypothetical protein BAU18_05970 [Enterococcus diestrammenae]